MNQNQINFLQTDLGKVINNGIDIGLKAILPNFIEDQIIEIKDAIIENGFNEGIKQVIDSSIEIGKSALGIFTGKFENINQVQSVVKKGGLLDNVSDLLDVSINLAKDKDLINATVATMIKQGKNTLIESIADNIESTITNQIKAIEKLEEHCEKWELNYKNKEFDKMENSHKNIEKYLDKIMPFENIINKARKIENMHNLIKNNGQNFSLTNDEIRLAETLIV